MSREILFISELCVVAWLRPAWGPPLALSLCNVAREVLLVAFLQGLIDIHILGAWRKQPKAQTQTHADIQTV